MAGGQFFRRCWQLPCCGSWMRPWWEQHWVSQHLLARKQAPFFLVQLRVTVASCLLDAEKSDILS